MENDTIRRLEALRDDPDVCELSVGDAGLLKKTKRQATQDALRTLDVICCTCATAGDALVAQLRFSSCLIDEATQVVEPEALIPITLDVSKLVLVGDQKQLGPVVTGQAAKAGGLGVSLFERLLAIGMRSTMLDTQYRMHPQIAAYPAAAF